MSLKGEVDFYEIVEIGIDKFNIIDVRSESEFNEDSIPSAINIPLLNDKNRKIVGTIYKNQNQIEAKLKAVELVSPYLPDIVNTIYDIQKNSKYTLFYCWRGGLRSEFVLKLMRMVGINSSKLHNGYKSYRHYIIDYFSNYIDFNHKFITLYGKTGTGKTEVLENLKSKKYPVLNLEKAASHKGSNFGDIDEPGFQFINQKKFESRLWNELHYLKSNIIFTEGESSKIGKVNIPKQLFKKITSGISIVVDLPLDFRINYTIKRYNPEKYIFQIKSSLKKVKKYLGKYKTEKLFEYLDKEDYPTFTRIILEDYYDPMYKKSFPKKPDYFIKADNLAEVENNLREIYEKENII